MSYDFIEEAARQRRRKNGGVVNRVIKSCLNTGAYSQTSSSSSISSRGEGGTRSPSMRMRQMTEDLDGDCDVCKQLRESALLQESKGAAEIDDQKVSDS